MHRGKIQRKYNEKWVKIWQKKMQHCQRNWHNSSFNFWCLKILPNALILTFVAILGHINHDVTLETERNEKRDRWVYRKKLKLA